MTEKNCDSEAPLLSVSVTVQLVVPEGSPAATTVGVMVTELSQLINSSLGQLASPLSQVALVAPAQVKAILVRLVKLLPVPVSVAVYGAVFVVIVAGLRANFSGLVGETDQFSFLL